MQNLFSSLALMVSVGILALLAQWSRKNRMAEISLLIVLAVLSFLILAMGGLLGIVWVSGQVPQEVYPQKLLTVTVLPVAMAGLIGLALCVPTLLKIVGRRPNGEFWSDPPVFFALWLFATVLLANNLIGILGFEQLNRVDAFSIGTGGRIPPVAILASQLPFFVVAVLGVGAGIRRSPRETLAVSGMLPSPSCT